MLGLFIIFTSLTFLVWSMYPLPQERKSLQVPGIGQLNLTWPSRIRKGDVGTLKLEYDSAELGIGGVAAEAGETPTIRDTHKISMESSDHILAETRVELPGFQIRPGEELIQPVQIGEKLTFNWQITNNESGEFDGEFWIYLKAFSEDGGDVHRFPIAIVDFQTQNITVFGLTGKKAREIGIIGIIFALILWRDIIGGHSRRLLNWSKFK